MPELPEVETVRRFLESKIIGDKIQSVNLKNLKSLRNSTNKELLNIEGQTILNVGRFAKHLVLNMTNNYLIMHLRMEGKFLIFNNWEEMEKNTNRFHDVVIFETDKQIILFQDTRKFATIDLFNNKLKLENNPIYENVANEPYDMTGKELFEKINRKRVAIKTVLLDQKIISGIGNIYADEILFAVRIHPQRKCNEVTKSECDKIIRHAIRILNKSIAFHGTTINNFTSSFRITGQYQKFLKIHQSKTMICVRDKTKVKKIKVGGRGTFFCETCQK